MADTAVATVIASKTLGTNIAAGQGTAIVAANTHVITPAGPLEELLIFVENTEGSTNDVTVLAGDDPPASAEGQGNLVLTLAATSGRQLLPPLESARFIQSDGTVRINVETGMTGFILPVQYPRI